MTTPTDDYVTLINGMEVFDSAGEKLGKIVDVQEETILVEKGFFFPKDYLIPVSVIDGVNENDQVFLSLAKDSLTGDRYTIDGNRGTGSTVDPVDTSGAGIGTAYVDDRSQGVATSEVVSPEYIAETDTVATAADATRVPVYEEQVTPVKRAVSRGAVRIQKELVTENRTITVPVTEERVRITQVTTDEPVAAGANVLQNDTIEIPLTGEEVDLQTSVRQTGEVLVEKESVQHDETVAGTVRREEVTVDDETVSADGITSTRRDDI